MKKINSRKKGSLTGKVFRLLGMNRGFEELPSGQQEIVHIDVPADKYYNDHDYRKEFETAWLEAEQKKAQALMEWQRRRFIC